jgi:hypothetical protein
MTICSIKWNILYPSFLGNFAANTKLTFMKRLLFIMSCALFVSCDMIDYHPYDVDISGECGVNDKNIKIIESSCFAKDTIRVVFTGDTQGWFDDTKDMVKSINNQKKIDFVVHGGDLTDFGITKEFEWQRDILNGLDIPYVVIIGNHDCLANGEDTYNAIFGDTDFSFIAGRIKFVCLNTNAFEYDYSSAIPNFSYMENQVTADSADFDRTVVCMHAGPYCEQFNNNVAKPFEYYVRMFPNVLFCTKAHDHQLTVDSPFNDGIMYYGSDCAKDRNYLLFTITSNGYNYEVIYF